MEKWLKIEEFLNKLLESFFKKVASIFAKMTPGKVSEKISQITKFISSFKVNPKEKLIKLLQKLKITLNIAIHKISTLVNKLRASINKNLAAIKSINWKSLNLKALFAIFIKLFSPLFIKVKTWYLSLRPITIAGIIATGTIASLASLQIYNATKDIQGKAQEEERSPSSVQDEQGKKGSRPAYYKVDEKSFRISNISFPTHIGDRKSKLKNLQVDITIISTNRYIKEYLFLNYYKIQDKLNSSIYPIIPAFPLQDEGKIIIKSKIQKELNIMLHDLHIKGRIKEVHIHSILTS